MKQTFCNQWLERRLKKILFQQMIGKGSISGFYMTNYI